MYGIEPDRVMFFWLNYATLYIWKGDPKRYAESFKLFKNKLKSYTWYCFT